MSIIKFINALINWKGENKMATNDWDKKMDKLNKVWDKKLKKINSDWKKNPKKAIVPLLGILIVSVLIINFFRGGDSSYTYLKYKCVSKIKNITAYSTFELDKKSGLARSAAWVDVYPKKSYQTRRIIKWGDKIIMAPLMQKGDYKNSYFENDVHHMYSQSQLYTGWSKRKCKKVEAR